MNNYDLDMNFEHINFDENEIKDFLKNANTFLDKDKIKDKKKKIIEKIVEENNLILQNKANGELLEGEFLEIEFMAKASISNIILNKTFSAENMVAPILTVNQDVATKYKVFLTDKKIMIYELVKNNHISREYIINFEDIKKCIFKNNDKILNIKIKCIKDKYDNFREAKQWFLFSCMNKTISFDVKSEYNDLIEKFLRKRVI